jgi:uncharacterized protein (DUF433 family)
MIFKDDQGSELPNTLARPSTIAATRRDEIVADILAAYPALTVAEVLAALKEGGCDPA